METGPEVPVLVVELALPEFIDSTHPAGDSTLVTTWDTVSACLGQPGFRTGTFNDRFSLSAIAKVPVPQMTCK